ncbi:potassium-transporting ATPase subunit F [Pedobacter hiemivivus]|nr:potassium-transporting ATPase subunit F [Pedobacter hiemivivus]
MTKNPSILEGFFVLCPETYSCYILLCIDNQIFTSYCLIVVCQLAIAHQKQHNYVNNPFASCPAATVLGVLQINRLVRENLKIMIALFIIALAVFIYMIYVLIKPEKF